MTTVDPYTQPFPKTIQDKSGNITPEFRQWLVFDNRWKFDMWIRSGGSDDAVSAGSDSHGYSENLISLLIGQVAFLKERVDALEKESPALISAENEFNDITVSGGIHTAVDFDDITAKSGAYIYMPENPSHPSTIIIRNGDGSAITIDGNGRNVRGSSKIKTVRLNTSLVLKYKIDINEYVTA